MYLIVTQYQMLLNLDFSINSKGNLDILQGLSTILHIIIFDSQRYGAYAIPILKG